VTDQRLESTIREIAGKHGVALGRDDPILIIQTLHDQFLRETTAAQSHLLEQFKQSVEASILQWQGDAQQRSDKIVTSAANGCREDLNHAIQIAKSAMSEVCEEHRAGIVVQTQNAMRTMRQLAWINLSAAAVTALAVCSLLLIRPW
jgi:hypothetical protein